MQSNLHHGFDLISLGRDPLARPLPKPKQASGLSTGAPSKGLDVSNTLDALSGQSVSSSKNKEDDKLWKASLDFEAMFLGQMYKAMRKTVVASPYSEMSPGREIFSEMLDQEYAKSSSKSSLIRGQDGRDKAMRGASQGIAAQLYRAMKRSGLGGRDGVPAMNPPQLSMGRANLGYNGYITQSPVNANRGGSLPDSFLEPIIAKASAAFQVSKNLIKSVIRRESANNPLAISSAGAKGLMQIMDGTAKELKIRDVFNPVENIMAGTRYLKNMLDKFGGDETLALAAYNAGAGNVEKHGGMPPFAETRAYVQKVLGAKRILDERDKAREVGNE